MAQRGDGERAHNLGPVALSGLALPLPLQRRLLHLDSSSLQPFLWGHKTRAHTYFCGYDKQGAN